MVDISKKYVTVKYHSLLFCCKYLTVNRLKMLMFCLGNKIVTITQIQYLVSVLYGKGMKNNPSGECFNVL